MALTRIKKNQVVEEVSTLLSTSKLTVIATYKGTPVKAMQDLRRQGKSNGTNIRVVKNRLFIKAITSDERFSSIDTSSINGMLLYAFNDQDEVAPAQTLANFAKTQPTLEFVGAITADGMLIDAIDVKSLANLPSKDQLRAQLIGTIGAPISSFVSVLSANISSVLYVLQARAEALEQ